MCLEALDLPSKINWMAANIELKDAAIITNYLLHRKNH
jgi:hypothetical protein